MEPTAENTRTWGARVRTFDSIDDTFRPNNTGRSSSSSSSSSFKIQHIPDLPQHEKAKEILERIKSEFTQIVKRRGYSLTTVTEMCCCGDGLDHYNRLHKKKRGRKARIMPNNVLGYNLTSGSRSRSVHRIHLRLRHPKTHILYPYEDIAGTMCHELAHCERGPHDAQFYKLMDEIMEQHAVYMAKGIVADKDGFPLGSAQAYRLGGGRGNATTRNGLDAAQRRMDQQRRLGGGSYILGGNRSKQVNNKGQTSSLAHLPPHEAARIAAERRVEMRRINDSLYCLPCNEVIEILDESSSDSEQEDEDVQSRGGIYKDRDRKGNKKENKRIKNNVDEGSKEDDVIDLTDDGGCLTVATKNQKETSCPQPNQWSCVICTFSNSSSIALACSMCGATQPAMDKANEEEIQKILRTDFIESVKEKEVKQSANDFDGFNIYGNTSRKSRTMNHLT